MKQPFYITTTIPYVNAAPHLGFAWELLTADIIARYKRAMGHEVAFNTGTDEHGQKVWEMALANNLTPQEYTDQLAPQFKELETLLNISNTLFIRTTDPHHKEAAQEIWRRCLKNGDIYKKQYQVKYCVGCELEKTDSELENGCCPLHPNKELEVRDEENYFFRFSKYQDALLKLYERTPDFVRGQGKLSEIKSFVKRGLNDFSISRVKEKMPWGVPVPDDDEQVMYVWFDALTNYISTLGWPNDKENFAKFWPGVQIAGKDNLRQQSAIWQAMLASADLPHSDTILINGFIMVEGQKMSKSLGNVISPNDLVEKYGQEATRFIIATFPVLAGDVDISDEQLRNTYQSELVNGLGNLCSRVAKMAESINLTGQNSDADWDKNYCDFLDNFQTHKALEVVRGWVNETDKYLSDKKPWAVENENEKAEILNQAIISILRIAKHLVIYMPNTSEQITKHFSSEKITALTPMFPRVS